MVVKDAGVSPGVQVIDADPAAPVTGAAPARAAGTVRAARIGHARREPPRERPRAHAQHRL